MISNLTDDDEEYLKSNFKDRCECLVLNGEQAIIIKDYKLPEGYNHTLIELMVLVPVNYPMAQLDMFYVSPSIAKKNNRGIKALNNEVHVGREWQRWSRHYPWEPGVHNVATHLKVVENSFKEELKR